MSEPHRAPKPASVPIPATPTPAAAPEPVPDPAAPALDPEPAAPAPAPEDGRPLVKLFLAAYAADPFSNEVLRMLDDGVRHSRKISLAKRTRRGPHLCFRDRVYVSNYDPLCLRLLKRTMGQPQPATPDGQRHWSP